MYPLNCHGLHSTQALLYSNSATMRFFRAGVCGIDPGALWARFRLARFRSASSEAWRTFVAL
jgi:hypothetical protein